MLDQPDTPASFRADHDGATAAGHRLEELLTHHYRPFEQEADPRPLPEPEAVEAAMLGAMNALADVLTDTRLEDDAADLLWTFVNLFHRRAEAIHVEVVRPLADRAPETPQVNHSTMTAAMIDSRDFLAAKRRAETEILVPPGPRIALTGGQDYQDIDRIWGVLDRVKAKHPTMVLLHGGSPKGAELIAAKWADARKVPQVAFRPDWTRHGKAAPFRRNDAMLEALPIGVVHFPGGGISDNLADKALSKGIPVRRGVKPGV